MAEFRQPAERAQPSRKLATRVKIRLMASDDPLFRRFVEFGDALFPRSFSVYLSETGRALWGLLISSENRRFERLFGNIPQEDLDRLNARFSPNAAAGYRVRVRDDFADISADADVLIMSTRAMLSPRTLDALLLHELSHWYIDSDLMAEAPLVIEEIDRSEGRSLYGKFDCYARENEERTRHTIQFCEVLSNLARRAKPLLGYDLDQGTVIKLAMQFDIFD